MFPSYVNTCLTTLRNAGFTAYPEGGRADGRHPDKVYFQVGLAGALPDQDEKQNGYAAIRLRYTRF